MKRIFLLNVLLLCLAIVAGCSTEKQADSTQNGVSDKPATENASHTEVNVDPRSLVSLDEVKMIFNQEVIYTEMEKIGPMLSTTIENDKGSIFAVVQVHTKRFNASDFEKDMKTSAEIFEETPVEINGIGDKAYWISDILVVLKDGVWVQFAMTTGPETDTKAMAISLANRAVGRL